MSQIQIPSGWELKKLSEACQKITSGGTPRRDNSSYFGGNIPWLKIGDLNEGMIYDSEEHITKEGLENSSAKLFPINTVLIAMYGATIGKTGILGTECATNQAICGMICKKDLNPKYLLYFLKSKYHEIRAKAEGGAQPNINQDKLKNFEIPIPSIEIQEKIIQKLDSILAQLEDKKKIILQIQKRNQEHKEKFSTFIFPSFIWNLISKYSGNKFEILSGYIQEVERQNPLLKPGKYFKYVEIKSIDSENKTIQTWKMISGKEAPSRARNVMKENDVIFATTRPYYRNVALVPKEFNDEICSTGFCVLRVNDKNILEPKFLYYFLQTDFAINQILKHMRGGSYPAVSNNDVKKIKFPLIDISDQRLIIRNIDVFQKQFNNIRTKIALTQSIQKNLINNLSNIPHSFLNQAFSGKLIN